MLNGGELQASFKPTPNVPVTNLQFYPPEEIIQILGMNLTISGEKVDFSAIDCASASKAENVSKKAVAPAVASIPRPRPRLHTQNVAPPQTGQLTFHTASVQQLKKHVGRKTNITMHDGRVREGVLNTVNEWRIQLVIRSQTGSMSFPIKIADINKVRVRY